jgi:dTMP kinase
VTLPSPGSNGFDALEPRSGPGKNPGVGRRRGLFVVLEGVEGSGKSTQIQRISLWLRDVLGIPTLVAREPGGTPAGEAIRGVLLDRTELRIGAETELLLMLGARAAFVQELVIPTLDRGEIMLADRFELSTFAYQGVGRGLSLPRVRDLNAFATGGLRPDLVVVLDVPSEIGRGRQRREGKLQDRIEAADPGFHERVAAGYRALATTEPNVVLIPAHGSADEVEGRVRDAILPLLRERFPELVR